MFLFLFSFEIDRNCRQNLHIHYLFTNFDPMNYIQSNLTSVILLFALSHLFSKIHIQVLSIPCTLKEILFRSRSPIAIFGTLNFNFGSEKKSPKTFPCGRKHQNFCTINCVEILGWNHLISNPQSWKISDFHSHLQQTSSLYRFFWLLIARWACETRVHHLPYQLLNLNYLLSTMFKNRESRQCLQIIKAS